jgi:hypothetical protein
MSLENKPTMHFLHKLAGRSVTQEFDYERFSQKDPEEKLEILKNLAEVFELENQDIDFEGLSQIEEERVVGFFRKAFSKYQEWVLD